MSTYQMGIPSRRSACEIVDHLIKADSPRVEIVTHQDGIIRVYFEGTPESADAAKRFAKNRGISVEWIVDLENVPSRGTKIQSRVARINGIVKRVPKGAIAWKYNDPIEKARWVFTREDLTAIERQDRSLIERVFYHDDQD